jgi:TolA-binding protein
MNLKDYERAVVHFQEVIDKYPKSDKAPKALLRQAEAFAALGDKKSSTTLLKRVVELFPKSEEARIADRMLRSVGAQ